MAHFDQTGSAASLAGAAEPATPAVSFERVRKEYPNGVVACESISFEIRPGTVHAIIGENGAGKSTLMKVLYGMEQPSSGRVLFDGEAVSIPSPQAAIDHGIGMVHQAFMTVGTFTITQNITLGAEPRKRGFVDSRRAVAEVRDLARQFQLDIDPLARAQDVSVGMLQRAEILKALYRGARILILDEPTAVLTPQETIELFRALRGFAASGRTVIFISHKLREVLEIADEITVMRGGHLVGQTTPDATDEVALAGLMVGRSITITDRHPAASPGEVALEVAGLSCLNDLERPACTDIDLAVRAGEIVGIVGVEGNGQTELVEVIAGLRAPTGGEIRLHGSEITASSVRERRAGGLHHIPEDRMKNGVALPESIEDNLIVDRYTGSAIHRGRLLSPKRIGDFAEMLIERFGIRAADSKVPAGSLSGGNIQKLIVARELGDAPRVLLASQPTRGVDIGAMEFIYSELREARDAGCAVLLVSADLGEALTLSDRIAVLREGRVVARFDDVASVTEEDLGQHMLGAADSRETR